MGNAMGGGVELGDASSESIGEDIESSTEALEQQLASSLKPSGARRPQEEHASQEVLSASELEAKRYLSPYPARGVIFVACEWI